MGDDELWHDLEDHLRLEGFPGRTYADVTKGLLEEMNVSLLAVDVDGLLLPFLGILVVYLPLGLNDFAFSEEKWQPVGELFIGK